MVGAVGRQNSLAVESKVRRIHLIQRRICGIPCEQANKDQSQVETLTKQQELRNVPEQSCSCNFGEVEPHQESVIGLINCVGLQSREFARVVDEAKRRANTMARSDKCGGCY
eukprot:SAG11_NODE_787_length_7169_cov_4.571146_4_plen_112_part_00